MAGTPPQRKRRSTGYERAEEHLRRDRWQNDETHRESQLAADWSDAWVRYLDHIAQIDISMKRRKNREVDTEICIINEVLTKMDRHQVYHKDQGTKKQRTHQSRCKGNRDKIWVVNPIYPKKWKMALK